MNPSTHAHTPSVRPAALALPVRWLGSLLLLVLLAVGWARWQGVSASFEAAPARWQRTLHFVDTAEGDVLALDARTGAPVARFVGEQGFVRGTLRALARERIRRGLGPEAPLELTGLHDGRLILRDPSTGEHIGLEAFGASNLAVFAALRPAANEPPNTVTERKTP